jgi:hypothetical protein
MVQCAVRTCDLFFTRAAHLLLVSMRGREVQVSERSSASACSHQSSVLLELRVRRAFHGLHGRGWRQQVHVAHDHVQLRVYVFDLRRRQLHLLQLSDVTSPDLPPLQLVVDLLHEIACAAAPRAYRNTALVTVATEVRLHTSNTAAHLDMDDLAQLSVRSSLHGLAAEVGLGEHRFLLFQNK